MTKPYVSPTRFAESNPTDKLANELLAELQAIDYDENTRPAMVTLFDILGERTSYAPDGAIHNVNFDGSQIPLDGFVRGLAAHVTSGNGKPDDAQTIADWLLELSSAFAGAVDRIAEAREFNDHRFDNKVAYDAAKELWHNQRIHEANMIPADLAFAEQQEEHERALQELRSENAKLKSSHNSLAKKISSLMPKKAPAKDA